MRRTQRVARALLACGVTTAIAGSWGTASASPLFELTGGVAGGGGFNARAVESGSASTYFNPAFLPDASAGFDLGVFVLSDQIGVHVHARPDGADIPVDSVNAQLPAGVQFPRHGLPTDWLANGKPADAPDTPLPARPRQSQGSGHNLRVYQVIGFVAKLFDGRVGVGLYALVPYSKFTGASAFYADEREQYFSNSLHAELYSDRLTATSLAFGLGAKLHEQLSIGLAFTLGLRTVAGTPTYVNDVGHFQDIMVDSNVGVSVSLAPHLGAVWKPRKGTNVALTVHSPQKFEIGTDFTFLLANGLQQGASISFTHAYLPWMIALGASHEVFTAREDTVSITATALYARWSSYIDRHSDHPEGAYAWFDTLSPAVGVRWKHSALSTFADAVYQKSPIPSQTGRTNYVDNDRVGGTFGFDYKFALLGGTLRAGVSAQVHRLIPRDTWKTNPPASPDGTNHTPQLVTDEVPDTALVGNQPLAGREGLQTNNPGWPGFASAGWIFGGGVNANFTF